MVGSVYEVRTDWGVPGLARRKTAVSGNGARTQGWSGRSRSISRPTPRQPLGQTSRAHPFRQPSRGQHHGQQLRYPLLHDASPYDDRYASEDDELPESARDSAPDDSRGRHRNLVGASSATPLPQRYCPPNASTHSTVSSHGQGRIRDGDGDRDRRGPARDSLLRDPERAPYGRRRSQRGGVGSSTGVEQHLHPHSPQIFDLPLGQRLPPAQLNIAAPAPPQNSYNPPLASHHYQEYPDSGIAPPRHAHAQANITVPRLKRGGGIARADYTSHGATEPPPPPRPLPSPRRQTREPSRSRAAPASPLASRNPRSSVCNGAYASMNGRSGLEREGRRERERTGEDERGRRADRLGTDRFEAERLVAELGLERTHWAGMAGRRRTVRKEGNHEMVGEEGVGAAKPNTNPDPVPHAHPCQQAPPPPPPPPPFHTRPRSFLRTPQQHTPAHGVAAAFRGPPPPPAPSSAAPRPQIRRGIPTAPNARDILLGFSQQEDRDDGGEDRGYGRADGLESTLRNPYLHPADRRQESAKEKHDKRVGQEALRSGGVHPQLPPSSRQQPPPPQHPGYFDTRSRPSSKMPQQQGKRAAHLAAAYAPPPQAAANLASDRSDRSSSSSSAATSRGNAPANATSTGPRGGRVGALNPDPRRRLSRGRQGAKSVSDSVSTTGRERPEVPRPSSIKVGERATPQQQRRPASAAAPAPRNPRPSSSVASRPRNPVHANGCAGVVDTRSIAPNPRTAPDPRRPGVRSVNVGSHGHGHGHGRVGGKALADLPKPSSPCWSATGSRWGEPSRRTTGKSPRMSIPAGSRGGGQKKKSRGEEEEAEPTLRQKVGYKLWVTALSCM